jgi:hypothetical protein
MVEEWKTDTSDGKENGKSFGYLGWDMEEARLGESDDRSEETSYQTTTWRIVLFSFCSSSDDHDSDHCLE